MPRHEALLAVLENMKQYGFTSIGDFLLQLFATEDATVKRRVGIFYANGGFRSLLETFMSTKKARENGGDELAVHWASGVLKEEFETGLVKGGVGADLSREQNPRADGYFETAQCRCAC
jgi:hypothetical protein